MSAPPSRYARSGEIHEPKGIPGEWRLYAVTQS